MKQGTIKLNESTLRKIVAESVKKVLKEADSFMDYKGQWDRNPNTPSKYETNEYVTSYRDKWLKWANVYGTKWAKENGSDVNMALKAASNYINAVCGNNGGLIGNDVNPSPKKDAYDYFFGKDNAIGQSMETMMESSLRKIVAESVKKVLKEYLNNET